MCDCLGSIRLSITAGVLLGASVLLQAVTHGEPVVSRQPLRELPYKLASWIGKDYPIDERIVEAAGVSDYTNRVYLNLPDGSVQLYVGFYATQRTGDTIHSPKNCLPGEGWDPIRSEYMKIPVSGGRQIVVNEYVIEHDQDQDEQLVFYWYQGRGRVVASEYRAKFWMVADAISRNRTDSALIRLITPVSDGEAKARARLLTFTQLLFPKLDELIPR